MRPKLEARLDPDEFARYYWLKAELVDFCRRHGLRGGGKVEVTNRIENFLRGGASEAAPAGPTARRKKRPARRKSTGRSEQASSREGRAGADEITLDAVIPISYRSNERHRAFFRKVIGRHFRFNVPFMNWMKENAGRTYRAAVQEWQRLDSLRKQGKGPPISAQFEYNQYTRDFFAANPGASRAEAIRCWKHKRSLPGHNRYEDADLSILR